MWLRIATAIDASEALRGWARWAAGLAVWGAFMLVCAAFWLLPGFLLARCVLR